MKSGLGKLAVISMLMVPFAFLTTIFGIQVSIRTNIDVPKYKPSPVPKKQNLFLKTVKKLLPEKEPEF
jgi:hypothetical protein